eukprot:1195919-Prorocentrum_minimum.AAC.1
MWKYVITSLTVGLVLQVDIARTASILSDADEGSTDSGKVVASSLIRGPAWHPKQARRSPVSCSGGLRL